VSQLVGFLLLLIISFTVVQLFFRFVGWFVKKFIPSINSAYECFIERLVKIVEWFAKLFAKQEDKNQVQKMREKMRELVSSVGVGLLVAFIIHFAHTLPVVMDIEDASMDLVMKIRESILPSKKEEKVPQFVVLDIDEETYKEWHYPPFTPRNYLKNLIETAVKAEAQLVVVDVDLSQETPFNELKNLTEGTNNERNLAVAAKKFVRHPFDQALYDYLYNYKRDCENNQASGQPGCVPIILFGPAFTKIGDGGLNNVTKIGFLESAVDKSIPYIQWAPATFLQSPDQVVRRWPLWQPVCAENGQAEGSVIPSMALLVALWFRNSISEHPKSLLQFQKKVSEDLNIFKPSGSECQNKQYNRDFSESLERGSNHENGPNINVLKDLEVELGKGITSQRIFYRIPWKSKGRNESGEEEEYLPPRLPYQVPLGCSTNDCVLDIKSAMGLIPSPLGSRPDLGFLKDKIVIIGGSHNYGGGKGDIHFTPLGEMLGALLIVNATYSLLQGDMKPLEAKVGHGGILLKCLIDGVLIVLMSAMMMWWPIFYLVVVSCGSLVTYYYGLNPEGIKAIGLFLIGSILVILVAKLSRFFKMVLSATIIIGLLLLVSVQLAGQGTWFEVTIPLIAALFHQIVDAVEGHHKKDDHCT